MADLRTLGRALSVRFRSHTADWRQSAFQLATTGGAFAALLALMVASYGRHPLALLLAAPAAGLLVRLFIFQHDCGHGSFFKRRGANDVVGRLLGVLTLTPYGNWAKSHAVHHACSGNLDRRGRGDVDTLTVAEYRSLSPTRRLGYRLYRNPFVMVLIGAPLNFILLQRLPTGRAFRDRDSRRSILWLNAALVVVFGAPIASLGVGPVLATYLPVIVLSSWFGNWLFYIQHQFDEPYWERDADWDFHSAALRGASYFELPAVLRWFSGDIGLHHVHHLCSRVPNYRLQACLDDAPELGRIARRITLRESLGCWRLALWDEQARRLVGFGEARP